MFKKIITSLCVFGLLLGLTSTAFALNKSEAIEEYRYALFSAGVYSDLVDEGVDSMVIYNKGDEKARNDVNELIDAMEASQAEVVDTIAGLDKRVKDINLNDPKKDDANDQLKVAKDAVDEFDDYDAKQHLQVTGGAWGTLPRVLPGNSFQMAEDEAIDEMNNTNRILIDPRKPGNVPSGDLMEDFLPQLIRQLFRFAWIAVLVALVISGIMFVTSFDNEERITKAKHMIYYTLIGFVAVTLAFAVVKAITDIDFFRFI